MLRDTNFKSIFDYTSTYKPSAKSRVLNKKNALMEGALERIL
jgi:hypothetical protein